VNGVEDQYHRLREKKRIRKGGKSITEAKGGHKKVKTLYLLQGNKPGTRKAKRGGEKGDWKLTHKSSA